MNQILHLSTSLFPPPSLLCSDLPISKLQVYINTGVPRLLADVTLNGNGMWSFDPANKMWIGCCSPFMESIHEQVMIQDLNRGVIAFRIIHIAALSHDSSPKTHHPSPTCSPLKPRHSHSNLLNHSRLVQVKSYTKVLSEYIQLCVSVQANNTDFLTTKDDGLHVQTGSNGECQYRIFPAFLEFRVKGFGSKGA